MAPFELLDDFECRDWVRARRARWSSTHLSTYLSFRRRPGHPSSLSNPPAPGIPHLRCRPPALPPPPATSHPDLPSPQSLLKQRCRNLMAVYLLQQTGGLGGWEGDGLRGDGLRGDGATGDRATGC